VTNKFSGGVQNFPGSQNRAIDEKKKKKKNKEKYGLKLVHKRNVCSKLRFISATFPKMGEELKIGNFWFISFRENPATSFTEQSSRHCIIFYKIL